MPFITDDPIVPTGRPFISNDPAVPMSPEETAKAWESGQLGDDALTPAQALQITLQKAKSRQDPMALIRGALAGTTQLMSQGWEAGKELASSGLKNPPLVANFNLTKAAAEGALRGSADLGQIGKNVLEGAVLNPYEIVSKAAEKRGWPMALAQAAQAMQPSLEVGTPMEKLAKIFPLETADVARQSMISDRQTARQRQQLAENKRSLLEELTTAVTADPLGMLPFGDSIPESARFGASPATAEALGRGMAPPTELGNLTEMVGMVADPTMLAAPGASLAAKLGAKVAPRMAARLGAGQVAGQARQALLEGFEQAAQAAPPSRARFVGGPEGGIRDVGPVPPPVIQPRFVGGPDGTVSIKAPPVIPTTPELAPLLDAYTGAVRQAAGAPRGMGQAAVGRVGRVAEQIGGAVSRAAETVGDLADRYRTALGVISATAGAIKGPLGVLAGSQLPKAVSMAAKWAKETSRAGAALRTIAAADWKSSVPVWRQIAKDPNAPQWLVRGVTAPVVGRLTAGKLAEGALRGGGRIAAGAAEGAATDALFAAADPEMGGEDIGAEAGPGGLIGFLSTSATARGAARQQKADAVAYDAMRIAARSIEAGANPLVVARASDRLMQTAAVMETLFRGSLTGQRGIKIDLMDAGQFAKVAGSSAEAAFFDPQTGRVAVNLETIDADGRQLHEVSHALMQSAASSNPAIVEHFRGLLGPDGLARARQEYQQALGREIPQDDAYIVGELFAESVANSLRGVDLSEGVPAAIGDTRTVSFFRDADVRKALRDASTQDLVRQQVDALTNFRPAVDLEREPGVKLDPAMAGKHPAFPVEQQANGTTGNDFVQQTPDGRTVATPPAQVRTRVRNRRREVLNLFPDTEPIPDAGPTAPPVPEVATRRTPAGIVQKTGTRLGDRFYATAQSFGEATKNMLRRVEDAIANGETLSGWYQQIGQGDNWAASVRESLGAIEAQFKDFIPYAFKVDKQGNLLVENYSLTALERKANQWANRQGPLSLEMWNGDIAAFRQDVQTYLRNHSEGRPGADGLGDGKRNVINVFLVGGNRTFEALNPLRVQARGKDRQGIVRSYRADRLQTVEPSEVQGFEKPDYGKQVRNLSPTVTKNRNTALQEAAQQVRDGKMTREEYQRLVQVEKPYQDMAEVPRPLSTEEVRSAIGSARADRAGKAREVLQEGQRVGARIDIRASEAGSYVTTLHEPRTSEVSGFAGKPITYEGGVRLRNVRFASNATGALDIAAGRAKGTIATIEGDYLPTPAEQVYRQAQRFLNDPEWAQLGMDPERQSQFYLRSTGEPVVGADEVLQVGRFVLARNVQKASPAETAARTQTRYTGPDGQPVRYSAKVEVSGPGSGMSVPKPAPFSRRKALPVPSWERAEQMWDAGYSLYGAPYDGLEGGAPLLLRSRDEIENFDPENLFAIPGPDAKPLPSDTRYSPRIEQSVLDLDKLGNKDLPQVNAKTIPYPANPAYPKSIALPARWGLVNEKIVGMPKTAKEVSDIVVRQVDRLERVIQDMPEFARESARFYLDMGLSSLDLAQAALPGVEGLEQHKMADLMLRFLALGSPRTGVAANATKSSYSISAAASDFTPGLKIGFGPQQRGAKQAMLSWKKDEPFDLNMEGIDNKVRNFYLNGISEIIDLAEKKGDTASYEHLMNKVAGSLNLIQLGETLPKEMYGEVKRLLDGMATVDMWDMAAKGFAWPGYIIDVTKRNDDKNPWQWSQDKFAVESRVGTPEWDQILRELSKAEKRPVKGPEDLRYQQARALRIEGNKDWSAKTWKARLESGQPFGPETSITVFNDASEAGLSPGGAGPLYDAQQAIDGLIADEINNRGLANLFGKDKLLARNAQEILWALERLDNPIEANNELVLFGQTFTAVKEALQARQIGENFAPEFRGEAVLNSMVRGYEQMASQFIPIEVVSAGTSPEAARIQRKIGALESAGVPDAVRVVTEAVAASLMDDVNTAAETHGLSVTVDTVRTGTGGYSEGGQATTSPNIVVSLRGAIADVRRVLEVLSRAMDQDGGNIFRRPTVRELNDSKTKLNNVLTFDTRGLNAGQQKAFFEDLNKLKDAQGNSFLTGFTQTGDGMAIGDQFYGGDIVEAFDANKTKVLQLMRQHNVNGVRHERLIVDTFFRGTPAEKGYSKNPFARELTKRVQDRIDAAAPAENRFPVIADAKQRIDRLTRQAVYARFDGKTEATRYFVDLASQVDVAILRDEITAEVGKTLKDEINRIGKRKIAQAVEKTAKAKEVRASKNK